MPLQPYVLPATLALLLSLYLYHRPRPASATSSPSHASDAKLVAAGLARDATGTFTCTVPAIHATRALLMARGLPTELADMVLERAEYWAVERAVTDREVTVFPRPSLTDPGTVDPAACPYLQTGPLGRGPGLENEPFAKCRRVVITVVSKDQGWASGGDAVSGTYRGAHSWFEASVVRADERRPSDELLSPLVTLMAGPLLSAHRNQSLDDRANFYHTTEPRGEAHALGRGGWQFVELEEGEVAWLVQRNRVAHREFLEHTIQWDEEEDEEWLDDEGEDDWPEDGRGSGRRFVAKLERGDRILIWGRAIVCRSVFRSVS
jgi:hypothetical protein